MIQQLVDRAGALVQYDPWGFAQGLRLRERWIIRRTVSEIRRNRERAK